MSKRAGRVGSISGDEVGKLGEPVDDDQDCIEC